MTAIMGLSKYSFKYITIQCIYFHMSRFWFWADSSSLHNCKSQIYHKMFSSVLFCVKIHLDICMANWAKPRMTGLAH